MTEKRILFAGGESDSFTMVQGSFDFSTDGGSRDSNYSRGVFNIGFSREYSADFISQVDNSPVTTEPGSMLSGMAFFRKINSVSLANMGTWFDADNRPTYKVGMIAEDVIGIQQNISTTATPNWQTIVSSSAYTPANAVMASYRIFTGALKKAFLYLDGSLAGEAEFTTTHSKGFKRITYGPANQVFMLSQLAAAENISLVNARVKSMVLESAGSKQDMTGAVTQISPFHHDDARTVNSTVAGQEATYNLVDFTVPPGYEIAAVFHWMRARHSDEEPKSLEAVYRVGSTSYSNGPVAAVDVGYKSLGTHWAVNPATGSKWGPTDLNVNQVGMRSLA